MILHHTNACHGLGKVYVKNFVRFINVDGTPKTDDEIKSTLKPEKKKKEKN